MRPIKAGIFGVAGLELTAEEIVFFTEMNPLGFILFKRNIDTPEQVLALTNSLRKVTGRAKTPILIDQEGGRVQRMSSPYWQKYSSARPFGDLYDTNREQAKVDTYNNAHAIAGDLTAVGINVNCLPLLDVPIEGADSIIGDRAFSRDKNVVSTLGAVQASALMEGGVLPIIKHIPGHGRAMCDSHLDLPRVEDSLDVLWKTDFIPFKENAHFPLAMTAHIIFTAIDRENPISCSEKGINFLRSKLNFDGLLMCDDLSMKALKGDFTYRTRACLNAGCDVILHCNGDMREMLVIASVLPKLSVNGMRRWAKAEASIS